MLVDTSVDVAEVSLIIAMVLLHFQVSPVVQMSADTWSLSFAKYLELRFYGRMYQRRGQDGTVCSHSLHHEHYQYFGMRNVVASFRYVATGYTQMRPMESSQVPSRSFCFQLPAYQLAYKLIDMIIVTNNALLWEDVETGAVTSLYFVSSFGRMIG
jgi:hypothetical protein